MKLGLLIELQMPSRMAFFLEAVAGTEHDATVCNTLEAENAGLKLAVADLTVDKLILKEVAEGKY